LLRVEVLRGAYGRIIAALFVFHLAQFLPVPLFPLFWVDRLHFNDGEIGLGTAVFHIAVFFGSFQFARLTRAWGNHKLAATGAALLSAYPLMTAFTPNLQIYLLTSFLGGIAWAMVGGALGNYLFEQLPERDRPAYLAWYNIALNAAILLGSLGGSILAQTIGLGPALLFSFVLRLYAGYAIWRWK
jgi:predicted MFS family arabinose efflux permease